MESYLLLKELFKLKNKLTLVEKYADKSEPKFYQFLQTTIYISNSSWDLKGKFSSLLAIKDCVSLTYIYFHEAIFLVFNDETCMLKKKLIVLMKHVQWDFHGLRQSTTIHISNHSHGWRNPETATFFAFQIDITDSELPKPTVWTFVASFK